MNGVTGLGGMAGGQVNLGADCQRAERIYTTVLETRDNKPALQG